MPEIYISYDGHTRAPDAAALIAWRFEQASMDIHVHEGRDLHAGRDFQTQYERNLNRMDLLFVLIEPSSTKPSAVMRFEIDHALTRNVPIIPILLAGAQMPSSPEWPAALRAVNAAALDLDPDSLESQLQKLVEGALQLLLTTKRTHEAPAIERALRGARTARVSIPPGLIARLFRRRAKIAPPIAPPRSTERVLAVLSLAKLDECRRSANAVPSALPPELDAILEAQARESPAPPARMTLRYRPPEPATIAPPLPAPPPPLEGFAEDDAAGRRFEKEANPTRPPEPAPKNRKKFLLPTAAAALLGGTAAYLAAVGGPATILAYLRGRMPEVAMIPGPTGSRPAPDRHGWLGPTGPLPWLPFLAAAGVAAAPTPGPGERPIDIVDVSAFAPNEGRASQAVLVQVYLHKLRQRAASERSATKKDPDTRHRETATLATEIPRGETVLVQLDCAALEIAEPVQKVEWNGSPAACSFVVKLPPGSTGKHLLTVRILIENIPVGRLAFALRVVAEEDIDDDPQIQGLSSRRYRYAFISYSSVDRIEVLKNVQILRALDIDFFQDILSITPGKEFEPLLFKEIDKCDLFLLFWSKSAAASEWVIREAEYALARQKRDEDEEPDIKPIILEGPPIPLPPRPLAHLHFNDFITHVIASLERAAKQAPPA